MLQDFTINVFKGINPSDPVKIPVSRALENIRTGIYKDQITKIRATAAMDKYKDDPEGLKKAQDVLKKKLPGFTFSGDFLYRKLSGTPENLLAYVPVICLDIDDLTPDELQAYREDLVNDPFIYALFLSPRGNGLKFLIWVQGTADNHLGNFLQLQAYFLHRYKIKLDASGKNIDRLCFASWDPDLYINPNPMEVTQMDISIAAMPFQPTLPAPVTKPIPTNVARPKIAYTASLNDVQKAEYCVAEIVSRKIDLTANYDDWIQIAFSLQLFGDAGRHLFHDISRLNEKYDFDDCNKKFDNALNTSTFKTPAKFFALCKEHGIKYARVRKLDEKGKDKDQEKTTAKNKHKDFIPHKFWWEFKDEETGKLEIGFNPTSMVEFLYESGFGKLQIDANKDSYEFIYLHDNIVRHTTEYGMKKFVFSYLKKNPDFRKAFEKLHLSARRYFSTDILDVIEYRDVVFNKDTRNESFIYYTNCFVKITGDKISIHPYKELKNPVWESARLKRNLKYLGDTITGDFASFIWKVATGEASDADSKDLKLSSLKFLSFMSHIGYMLHTYKSPSMSKAVVGVDEAISFDKKPNGRTGKGLLGVAMGQVRPRTRIEARNLRFDKEHVFQEVEWETKIIHYEDAGPKFDFTKLFGIITGGQPVKHMYEAAFTIPFEDAPKNYIETNYIIDAEDTSSYRDRMSIIEFSGFYSDTFKPVHDFGREFFGDQWKENDWHEFDTFMINCVKVYLKDGLVPFPLQNYDLRLLISKVPQEALDTFENIFAPEKLGQRHEKKQLYLDFIANNIDYQGPNKNSNTFSGWMKRWVTFMGYTINAHCKHRNYRDSSSGVDYITVTKNEEIKKEEIK